MSEMVERVAEAIATVGLLPECTAEKQARAAIAAMREPTSKMSQAATQIVPTWDDDASARKWRAMIDEALT